MPPRDDSRFPDDFPDLEIPDSKPRLPEPSWTAPAAPRTAWKVGDRVLAPWEPQFLYVGKIVQMQAGEVLIQFEDGDAGWVQVDHIRTLVVQRGQKVLSRRKMGQVFFQAEIMDVRGDKVRLAFADGHAEEWTAIAALRIPCEARGRGARPTTVASHVAHTKHIGVGDRVWAPWMQGVLFVGTVDSIQGEEVHIHFDDGDRGWVPLKQVVPLEIVVGQRIMGRRKMGTSYFPATIAKVDGERIFIQFDDGNKEWTTAAALAIPGDPASPNARPTKNASGRGTVWRWLIPVLVFVVFAIWRMSRR